MAYLLGRPSPPTKAAIEKAQRMLAQLRADEYLAKADACRHDLVLSNGYRERAVELLRAIDTGTVAERRADLLAKAEGTEDPVLRAGYREKAADLRPPPVTHSPAEAARRAAELLTKADAAAEDPTRAAGYREMAAELIPPTKKD